MDILHMIAVVEDYIYQRKGIRITINRQQFNHPLGIVMLNEAYTYAVKWNEENKDRI